MKCQYWLFCLLVPLLLFMLFISCDNGQSNDDDSDSTDDDEQSDDDSIADDDNDNDDNNDDTFTDDDNDSPDENGLVWRKIPKGSFEMGCVYEYYCFSDEYPVHTVELSAFFITETEITQTQYEFVLGQDANHSYFRAPQYPVNALSWEEAQEYCEAVEGRLPTEAEWEYAGRAGTDTPWYCGDDPQCLFNIAWFAWNTDHETLYNVGQKSPNGFGLYDMLGNADEWVYDWYAEDYYQHSQTVNPTGPADPVDQNKWKVHRGGNTSDDPGGGSYSNLRISDRGVETFDWWSGYLGMRCAKDVRKIKK